MKVTRMFNFADDFLLVLGNQLTQTDFKTKSKSLRLLMYNETTILDFRDSVVVVAAHAKNFLICDN